VQGAITGRELTTRRIDVEGVRVRVACRWQFAPRSSRCDGPAIRYPALMCRIEMLNEDESHPIVRWQSTQEFGTGFHADCRGLYDYRKAL
jgi:hypothetical protein